MNSQSNKLYIIVRSDIPPGLQLAQSCHAAFAFATEHASLTNDWMLNSNYIAILNVANEYELNNLIERAINSGIKFSVFKEPDIGNQITAITFEPGIKSKKLCANLKLALKET